MTHPRVRLILPVIKTQAVSCPTILTLEWMLPDEDHDALVSCCPSPGDQVVRRQRLRRRAAHYLVLGDNCRDSMVSEDLLVVTVSEGIRMHHLTWVLQSHASKWRVKASLITYT